MKESASVIEGLTSAFQTIANQILEYVPRIAVALLVLILGWLLARLIRFVVIRGISHLDQLWQRLIAKQGIGLIQPRHTPVRIVGELIFWLLMLVFLTLATEILGLGTFGGWLKEIVTYLPLAISGLLIVLAGYVVSSLVRDLITSAASTAQLSHGNLLGRIAQFFILFIAVVIGVDQIGIDIAFLSVFVGIVLASFLGSIALAFGIGSRTHVSNIIAANQLRQIYQIGDRVKIGDIEGRIIDIMVSRVLIETEQGNVDIPAKVFDEEVTMIIEKGG